MSFSALANPEGGQVTAGQATISSPDTNTVQINQTSDKAVIDWRSFNISQHETTRFQQPSSSSITLNRVDPSNGASNILGALTANGHIWVINPAGVILGASARVDAAGVVITTANISNQDFMAGNYHFVQSPDWNVGVVNEGTISVKDAGLVALVAPGVENRGVIKANLGTVALAAGKEFIVDFYGDQLINFGVNAAVNHPATHPGTHQPMQDGVRNSGKIIANGGKVLMTAAAASGVLDHMINMDGYVEAKTVTQKEGKIILLGAGEGVVKVSGKIVASGKKSGEKGGSVKVLGHTVALTENATVDVSGDVGGGEILIGGDFQGKNSQILNAKNTFVGQDVTLNADALSQGNGGKIIVWGDDSTLAYGKFSAQGGAESGNGGFIETSAHYLDVNGISVDLTAAYGSFGTWLLDPTNITINNNATSGIALAGNTYTPTVSGATNSTLNAGSLGTALNSANILVVTTNASGTGNGDITFNDPANQLQTNWANASTTLTLQADRNITFSSALTLNGTGKTLNLNAGQTNTAGGITISATMNGSFNLNMTSSLLSGATGTVSIGAILGGITPLSNVTVTTGGPNIALNANISTTGNQIFNQPVTMNASRVLNAGGDIIFNSTLDSANATARSITLNSSGVTRFVGQVGNTNALLDIITDSSGTTEINGGSVRARSQTYNDIVSLGQNTNFIAASANSDISLNNSANNITNTITYSTSGAGVIRDINLANNSVSAVIPTLPSSFRNLTLTFNSAAITLPALTLTGALNATAGGGNITQVGALDINGITTLASGVNNIVLNNASNNFRTIALSGANANISESGAIIFGASSNITGTLNVNAGGTITDTGAITADTLITTSMGGTTLDFGHNVNNFNATNTGASITFVNTANPLTITGINQSGGNINLTNTGTLAVADGVTVNAGNNATLNITATDLNLNSTGALNSGTSSTTITQNTASGSIGLGNSAGTMSISSSELQRINTNNLTLVAANNGQINIDGLAVTNFSGIAGNFNLTATSGTGSINFQGSSSILGRPLTANTTGIFSVADGVTAATNNLALSITAGDLNLNSTGALNSGSANTTLSENASGGVIELGNPTGTAGRMGITSSELQRITANTLAITAPSNGQIIVNGVNANDFVNIAANTTLTATAGTLGSIVFQNNPSSFRNLIATTDAGMTVQTDVSTTVGTITLTVNNGTLSFTNNATLATNNSNIALDVMDLDLVNGSINSGTANTSITAGAGNLSVGNDTSGNLQISGAELQKISANNLTLVNSSNNAILVDGVTAADFANISNNFILNSTTGTAGTISFLGGDSVFKILTATADAGITVNKNISTTTGTLSLTVNAGAGNVFVDNAIVSSNNNALNITAPDLRIANGIAALHSGTGTTTITSNSGGVSLGNDTTSTMQISGDELQRITAATLAVNAATDGSIFVDGVTAANTANIDTTTLTATVGTLGAINFQGSSSTFANVLTATTDNTFSVSNAVTLATVNAPISISAADLNLNSSGSLNSGNGDISITKNANGAAVIELGNVSGAADGRMKIDGGELQNIFANTLNLISAANGQILVNGVTAANSANIASTVLTATAGTLSEISFQTNPSIFKALTANADNGINLNSQVTTTTGDLTMDGNVTGNPSNSGLHVNADLISAGLLTLSAGNNGILLESDANFSANGMVFSDEINGPHHLVLYAGNGSIAFNAVVGGVTPLASLSATNTGTNNISITQDIHTVGDINLTAGNNLFINNGDLISATGNVALTAGASIQESGNGIINAALLSTQSGNGTTLDNQNRVTSFNASNTDFNNITLINTANVLTVTGITNAGGVVNITNNGELTINGVIASNGGNVNLTTLSSNNNVSRITVDANILSAGGSINISAANPNESSDAIVVNAVLNSTGGSGQGVLTVGKGVELNVAPIVGSGNINLQINDPVPVINNLPNTTAAIYIPNIVDILSSTVVDAALANNGNIKAPIYIDIIGESGNAAVKVNAANSAALTTGLASAQAVTRASVPIMGMARALTILPVYIHKNVWGVANTLMFASLLLLIAFYHATYKLVTGRKLLKSEFVNAVAFDLRTQLNNIIGFAAIMQHREIASLSQEQKEFLNDILLSGNEMNQNLSSAIEVAGENYSGSLNALSFNLRTVLNSVKGFSDLIMTGKAGTVSPVLQEYLGDMTTSSNKLLRLTYELDTWN